MTQEEYWQHVGDIRDRNPKEPLLAALEAGYSKVTVIYAKSALARLPESDAVDVVQEDDEDTERDEKWNELTRKIREGFNEVRRIHNLYHECKRPKDFIDVANQMRRAWEHTQRQIAIRKNYEEHGTVEEIEEIPENPALLAKMLNSLRVKRKQHQDKILELAKNGETEKLKAKEASLAKIKNTLAVVEAKMKEYEQAVS